jgi:hypothetical protein
MGTFHDHRGELHGITVVVDSYGAEAWIGRCDTFTSEAIVLLDGESYEGAVGTEKDDWIRRAAEVGIWKRFDRKVISAADIASVRRLSDISPTA